MVKISWAWSTSEFEWHRTWWRYLGYSIVGNAKKAAGAVKTAEEAGGTIGKGAERGAKKAGGAVKEGGATNVVK
jgi:hypothetical protein